MRAQLATVAIVIAALVAGAAPRLVAQERAAPATQNVHDVLARDAANAGAALAAHECTERPSALFGERTVTCRVELARGERRETVTRVLTPFDRSWAVTGR
jgi:hypothetical protein